MGIGRKMEQNIQLQEFVEKTLSMTFEIVQDDEVQMETLCDDLGITEDEVYWLFEQLGYTKEE